MVMGLFPEDLFTKPLNPNGTAREKLQQTKQNPTQSNNSSASEMRLPKDIDSSFRTKGKEVERKWNKDWLSHYTSAGNTSFSGADTKISIVFPKGKPVFLGEAQTLTYSLYRPMNPVYRLGSATPVGYVRGQRTVAGSIIFTVFDRNALLGAFRKSYEDILADKDQQYLDRFLLTDELPPFDLHATFLNEYGRQSQLVIHDVRVTSEGQVMSIEDLITENTMQYLATDITLMQPSVM